MIMQKPKVLLAVPNFRWSDWDAQTLWHFIPYNLCILAAMVKDICDVEILDAYKLDMDEEEFKAVVKERNPGLLGITVLMDQYASAGHTAARFAKSVNADIKVVIGGVYATTNPRLAIADSNIDFVVIGEGEYVFRELVLHFSDNKPLPKKGICYRSGEKIIDTGHSDFIRNLDDIALPAYNLIDFSAYTTSVHRKSVDSPRAYPYARLVTSRGCPYGCIFCQVESISGRVFRPRSADSVLNEISLLKKHYGVKSLIFDDDNLLFDKKRAKEIFKGMIKRGLAMPWLSIGLAVFKLDEELLTLMKASGCEYIAVAIESGTERVLKEIVKKPVDFEYAKKMIALARGKGIYVTANFIIGFPTETWDEIRQTIKFAEDIDVDYLKLFVALPLRNTRLWRFCEEKNAFKKGFDPNNMRWSTGQIATNDFSADDLTILRAYEWDRINFMDPKKRKRSAEMMGVTEQELCLIRKETIANVSDLIK
jgi:anaerobic magnesium-protoporphyrin IX monomethyl ester cyclase